ncbi:DUF4236 domain-containing protein [Brevifollis gellanilyticus]|nr:DUF4236 domain-containing protein [Brevifollis gellanilyticus]
MGFYLRKSISVGPLRFNLSRSGIGVSAGIKGLRVGTGPNGNYVHLGSNGYYYRRTLPLEPRRSHERVPVRRAIPSPSSVTMEEIDSGEVSLMAHSSSVELLNEINEKKALMRFGPVVTVFGIGLLWWLFTTGLHPVLLCVAIMFILGGVFLAWWRDAMKKTVVLFYDFDPEVEHAYGLLHDHAVNLSACQGVWHLSAAGKVHDKKYHAGASELVDRHTTHIYKASPDFLKTNIETLAIKAGRQILYLFPDRILVDDGGRIGAVGYEEINADVRQQRFIESARPPSDAAVVDQTWMYVNKKGGPDLRFASNPQLPICLYDELHLRSLSGVNERFQFSRHSIVGGFVAAIVHLGQFTDKHHEKVNA